ncbi:hypothetical protein [Leifsonia sp. 22587]|uniref:hypothetical protein n=1 Tax=Leifsonia sp. 22587 TaxID=3453946 RepID=UPI003F8677D1
MVEQRDESWVKAASPDQIAAAVDAGELAHYMGGKSEDEKAHDARVEGSPNRLLAELYGFSSYQQMTSMGSAYGSTLFESKRRDMTLAQLEKLEWLETASPAEVHAAEAAGDLDQALGRDVTNEAARLESIRAQVTEAVSGGRRP